MQHESIPFVGGASAHLPCAGAATQGDGAAEQFGGAAPAAAAARPQAAAAPGGARALNPRIEGFGARPHAPSVRGRGEPAAVAAAGGAAKPSHAVNPSHAETLMAEGGDARVGDAADVQASGEPLSPGLVTAGIVPLEIEREMWMSYAAVRQRRSRRLLRTGLAIVRVHTILQCVFKLNPQYFCAPLFP